MARTTAWAMAIATAMARPKARARRTRARVRAKDRARARDGQTDGRTAGRSYLFSEMRSPFKVLSFFFFLLGFSSPHFGVSNNIFELWFWGH